MSNEATWFENALSAMTTKGEAYSEKSGRAVLTNVCEERLTTVKEKAEQIKKKCLELSFDERDDMEGVISEIDVKLCFDEILQLIEEELQ